MENYMIIWYDAKTGNNLTKQFQAEDDEKAIKRALASHKNDIQFLCRIPAEGMATLSNSLVIYSEVQGALRNPRPMIELIQPEIPVVLG